MISSIVNMTNHRGIGFNNDMLYYIKDDLKRFKEITTGKTIIMGKNTFLSLKKPLPNRKHIVVSRDASFNISHELVTVERDLKAVLELYCALEEEAFIIGGGSIYKQAMPYCKKLYLTINDGDLEADVYFPEFDYDEWECMEHTEPKFDEQSKVNYWYETLIKK